MKLRLLIALLLCSSVVLAEEIGHVNTEWKLLGSHQLVVEVYDDPKVQGVSCYVSKPQRGGLTGAIGVAEELSDVSIACRQVAPIKFTEAVPKQETVFTERRSLIFKTLHIVRMVDPTRNTLVYLTYTDKLINGSPKNSVTAVPIEQGMKIPVK
ncbi:MAG: CreA family protein [Gallionella sp.]|nr:CreA family protein [Gallionella sp.]MDD4959865.1 CreA family protein [Gallionella sp.]